MSIFMRRFKIELTVPYGEDIKSFCEDHGYHVVEANIGDKEITIKTKHNLKYLNENHIFLNKVM